MVLPTNFYRTRIKEPVIITRIKNSSNLLIFLLCLLVLFRFDRLHASGAFFACCRTCNVLILSQMISACSMSSEIQLRFAFFLWCFKLWINIWRVQQYWIFPDLMNFRSKAVSTYLALMIFNFTPANSEKWGEMLDVNIHKTNKVVLALKKKRQRLVFMRKKVITRLCHVCVKSGSGTPSCFGLRNSKIVYQNSRLSAISTFSKIKVNRYENRGKVSRTS